MARVFEWEFAVRSYELDANGHVNNAVYHRYLEEAATRASTDAGLSYDWYMTQNRAWVVSQMAIKYLTPLQYGDRVKVRTWVSDLHRIYSHREYDMRRVDDDKPVARARAKWVYVNMETMRPARIPAEAEAIFQPTGELEDLHVHLRGPQRYEDAHRYETTRRVQRYELDPANVVNNSVYLNWFEQAMYDGITACGWPLQRLLDSGLGMVQAAHLIDYKRPAMDGDRLRIVSQPIETTRTRGAWQHDITLDGTDTLVARDYSVGAFFELATGKPCALPDEFMAALVAGRS